ncbi:hypothetical protein E4T42_02577 [Aureobasidium subglaciale]|nr:hypothetical protein E4T42_02577 [Aureobasidium subglaciale]
MASTVTFSTLSCKKAASIDALPDEVILIILGHLDYPFLLAVTRVRTLGVVSHRLRAISLDRVLFSQLLQNSTHVLSSFLPQRPLLRSLQPPASAIYLTRTHVAARRLHFRLLSATLNRSLSRRPSVSSLVNARILPRDCCRRDHLTGEIIVAPSGLLENKRKLELTKFKEGMRVWLEKKARAIKKHKSNVGGVGILVWRFSKKGKAANRPPSESCLDSRTCSETDRVSSLRRFWEDVGVGRT